MKQFMKTRFTILFFLDVMALLLLTYFFLKMADTERNGIVVAILPFAIALCIVFLIYIVVHYLKPPV